MREEAGVPHSTGGSCSEQIGVALPSMADLLLLHRAAQ